MTWPTGSVPTTNLDQDTDNPLTARSDIRAMADLVNQMLAADVVTQDMAALFAGNAGGSANTLTGSVTPAPASLTNGLMIIIRAIAANTGAATFNLNGSGNVAIATMNNQPLTAGQIAGASHILLLVYSTATAKWHLLNPKQLTSTGVSAGSYAAANVTVGTDGRVTAISSSGPYLAFPYSGSDPYNIDFPVGSIVVALTSGSLYARNAADGIKYASSSAHAFVHSAGIGTALTGTWRARGLANTSPGAYTQLFERTA